MVPGETAPSETAPSQSSQVPPGRGRLGGARWLGLAAWVLAAAVGFAVYLRLADTRAVNSDGASIALQAWDMLHGSVLLHGWMLADVTFYTTEIPQYALIEAVHGLGAGVVHAGAAMTYTLLVLLAAALAKGTAAGREAVFRVLLAAGIMLAPQLNSGTDVLVSSPDHIGTAVPVMVAWLVLDRAPRRWWVPAVTTVVLAWSAVADQDVLVSAIVPLIAVCALRLLRRDRSGYEAWLAVGAVVAGAAGLAAPHLIRAVGGYAMTPLASGVAPLHMIITHNLAVAVKGFLLLGGAYLTGLPSGAATVFALLHLVGVALALCGIAVTAWRFFRGEDLVPQLLLVGIVINVAAYVLGTHADIVPNAREMAAVLPFAAALTGRALPRLLTARARVRRVAVPVLGVVLAGYVAGLGVELTAPSAPPQNAPLAGWLSEHDLGTGLSAYWAANVVTLTSGGKAVIRPVAAKGGEIVPFNRLNKPGWYDPSRSTADFVALGPDLPAGYAGVPEPDYPGLSDRNAVIATFGQPARVYHVGQYTILQWHKNILADLPASKKELHRNGQGQAELAARVGPP
jgi:hypothetical protein